MSESRSMGIDCSGLLNHITTSIQCWCMSLPTRSYNALILVRYRAFILSNCFFMVDIASGNASDRISEPKIWNVLFVNITIYFMQLFELKLSSSNNVHGLGCDAKIANLVAEPFASLKHAAPKKSSCL